MLHELKTWTNGFQPVWEGLKLYEIRKADRPFLEGDALFLYEWDQNQGYSGRIIVAQITCISRGGEWGLPKDLCVLGIRVIAKQSPGPEALSSEPPPSMKST